MRRRRYQIEFMLKFWPLTHMAKRLGGFTPFKQMAGLMISEKALNGSYIPVSQEIEVPPGVVAPREIIRDYIERASHRTLLYQCPCRAAESCKNHPRELGCIMLGDGAKSIDPELGRPATVEEALDHMEKAIDSGLYPMVGHVLFDSVIFGAKPYDRLVTVCFCCDCCCIARSEMRGLLTAYPRSVVRLEGVNMEVGADCKGCGECVPVCPVENMTLVEGIATIGARCIGCSACVTACPRDNIKVVIEPDARMQEDLRRRIEAHATIE